MPAFSAAELDTNRVFKRLVCFSSFHFLESQLAADTFCLPGEGEWQFMLIRATEELKVSKSKTVCLKKFMFDAVAEIMSIINC